MNEVREGRARFLLPDDHRLFFNPRGKRARDLGVLALRVIRRRSGEPLVLADAFTGIGARVIRYALEVPEGLAHVWLNDGSPVSVVEALRQLHHNGVDLPVSVQVREAIRFFWELAKKEIYPHWIDLDAFGSPSPFFDHALLAVRLGGYLYFTATDAPPLCGLRVRAAVRNYGAHTIRSVACHELGLRVLLGEVIRAGGRRGHRVKPVFSVFDGYAFRVLVRVERGREDFPHRSFGMVLECPTCRAFFHHRLHESPPGRCPHCGGRDFLRGGPLWLGPLHDPGFVREMLEVLEPWYGPEKAVRKFRKWLGVLSRELPEPPYFYPLSVYTRHLGVTIPSSRKVVDALRDAGFAASLTHITGQGVKTTAPFAVFLDIVRGVALERNQRAQISIRGTRNSPG